jgi:hypothetical protein
MGELRDGALGVAEPLPLARGAVGSAGGWGGAMEGRDIDGAEALTSHEHYQRCQPCVLLLVLGVGPQRTLKNSPSVELYGLQGLPLTYFWSPSSVNHPRQTVRADRPSPL